MCVSSNLATLYDFIVQNFHFLSPNPAGSKVYRFIISSVIMYIYTVSHKPSLTFKPIWGTCSVHPYSYSPIKPGEILFFWKTYFSPIILLKYGLSGIKAECRCNNIARAHKNRFDSAPLYHWELFTYFF